ncbi:MAG TPA: STAS domain-containing protein [Streptosporangiaceae bacterium]|nr:STAS domain-containing protein [Streptosporangiaceae bacterium]
MRAVCYLCAVYGRESGGSLSAGLLSAGISPLTGCTGLRLNGEADMHTAEALRKALAELPPDASEIHLQLAGLEFIDVAAARHLAALAIRLSRPTVILHCPPPPLILLLRLLWPDSLDRFCVRGERADPETRSDLAAHQASGHRDNVVCPEAT